jgi:hypothetical protein
MLLNLPVSMFRLCEQNWCCKIKEILFEYGLNDVWLNQCVDSVENLLLKLKERIIGSFISEVTAFLENSPKCQFYKQFKHVIITALQYTIFSIQ